MQKHLGKHDGNCGTSSSVQALGCIKDDWQWDDYEEYKKMLKRFRSIYYDNDSLTRIDNPNRDKFINSKNG